MNTRTVDAQLLPAGPYPLDGKGFVGTGFTYETIESFLSDAPESVFYEGMMVVDTNNSVTWQVYYDGSAWQKRIYDGMIHVKAVSTGDLIYDNPGTVDGTSITDGDIVLQVSGLPQLRGLWIKDSTGSPNQGSVGGGYKRHPLFKTVEDQLANVIIVADNGSVWKNSQWVYTTMGALTGCAEDENGDAASPELLHWYYWALRPDPLELGNEDYTDLVDTGSKDSWIKFDCISNHSVEGIRLVASGGNTSTIITDHIHHYYVDATANTFEVYTPYNSTFDYVALNPNKEFFVQKTDSSTNYVAFYEDASDTLPEVVLTDQNDWFKTIIYQNPADVEDIEFITSSNRKTKQVTVTGITADGDTGVDIPAGYSVFCIQGTTNSSTADTFNIGLAAVGNELIDGGSFSSAAEVINTYQELTVDLTTPRSIYLSMVGGWPGGNATSIDLTFVFYQDNF